MHTNKDVFLSYDLTNDRKSGKLKGWQPGKIKPPDLKRRLNRIKDESDSRQQQFLNSIATVLTETMAERNQPLIEELARLREHVERPDLVKYNVPDAAKRLGRSRSSLYELIKAGELVPVKERGRTYITEEEIQRWERSQRN